MSLCYYDFFNCQNRSYGGQCYSGRSSSLSCPTCQNIGGAFSDRYGCYYYSDDCAYFSAGGQCHSSRYFNLFKSISASLSFSFRQPDICGRPSTCSLLLNFFDKDLQSPTRRKGALFKSYYCWAKPVKLTQAFPPLFP